MATGDEADRLYGLPLDEFTPARNELAKRLRSQGDREAAREVASLKKPTSAAWAVNQVVRSRPKERDALLRAGERLRKVHDRLAKGKADAAALREAGDEERGAVRSLMDAARGLLGGRREFLSQSVLDRVEQTLHAAAVDEQAREGLESGRLTRERQAVALGGLGGPPGAVAPQGRGKKAKAKAKPEPRPKPKARPEPKRAEEAERRKKRAGELRRVTREGEAELERLGKRLARAEQRREKAEAAAAEARAEEKDTRARARELERELRRARTELGKLGR